MAIQKTKYDKETDYKALMDQAAARGDYREAARLEQQRNAKIEREGLNYKQSSDYAGWLDDRDYGVEIRQTIASKGSKQQVADLLEDRVQKASGTVGMSRWIQDDIYQEAMDYLLQPELPAYESRYGSAIDRLTDTLIDRRPFAYDPDTDPVYQAYVKAYQREGRRATANALGAAAENTGGFASSYAVTAAQQAGSYYSAQQADIIPQLYELAWEVYQAEGDDQLDRLETLGRLEAQDYERYRDRLEDRQAVEALEYERYLDSLQLSLKQSQLDYDRERDALEDARYDSEWQYQLDRDALADLRYDLQQSLKGQKSGSSASGKKTSSAAEEESEAEVYSPTDQIRIYGMTGTYSRSDADALVRAGMVEKLLDAKGAVFYKLAALN